MGLLLEARSLTKGYAGRTVLEATHRFRPGVTAIMGANGSGKSTLLRLCALLEPPDSGEVVYMEDSHALAHDLSLSRRLTLVLPGTGIFDSSVLANAAYGLKVRGMGKQERGELAMESLEAVGLGGLASRRAPTLSSGESQRLGLARALAIHPEVLFLDEPTASVDEEAKEAIEELLLEMKERRDVPMVIMATHDRAQAERLADEIITLKRGRLVR